MHTILLNVCEPLSFQLAAFTQRSTRIWLGDKNQIWQHWWYSIVKAAGVIDLDEVFDR